MNITKYAFYATKIFGKKNICRLQSFLKYVISFKNSYSNSLPIPKTCTKRCVFMIDGKTTHGGLSDRLRGLFSIYYYCKQNDIEFKVYWDYPFKLQDYFQPNYNWYIEKSDLSFNKKNVAFSFFNSYSHLNNDEKCYYDLLRTEKIEHHIYSNVTIREDLYSNFFKELFILDSRVENAVNTCLSEINGEYISITFRFLGLIGDFKDSNYPELESEEEKAWYISKCIEVIKQLHNKYPKLSKILVTADSPRFLKEIASLPYVYIIPGLVVHMDNVQANDYNLHLKSFLDFLLISKAEKCYSYSCGRMFSHTKFARTAALIGGKEFIEIVE